MQKTEQEEARERVLAALDAAAGQLVTDDDVLFQGDKLVLPERFRGDLDGAIEALTERRDAEEEEFDYSREYPYRPYDGAAAFQRAIIRATGMSATGVTQYSFFGKRRPEYISAKSGPNGQTTQVPWGHYEVSMLEATFDLGGTPGQGGYNFTIEVTSKQKHRKRVDALLLIVEDELRQRSLYRGKAVSGDNGTELDFFDPFSFDRARIVYTNDVLDQLEANVWTPMRHAQVLRDMNVPLRRAVLLEGPNGTGKTSAGVLTAQVALESGWTFIRVATGDDPMRALQLAGQYAPAVVWYEDIDDLVAGQARGKVSKFMDVLDNVQNKTGEIIAVFTSNFPERIEKGVLRPGRIDAVIHVGSLDPESIKRLITALMPAGMLDANIDWGKVTEACKGSDGEHYLPAFITEVTGRALRYGVAREGRQPKHVSTTDLVLAAEGLRPQLDLMTGAKQAQHGKPDLDKALGGLVGSVLQEHELTVRKGSDGKATIVFAESNGHS
jgi:transitional endoplasmic reticulum ATPase